MSVYGEHQNDFSFWESNLATFGSWQDGEPVNEEEVTPADLELTQLQFTMAALHRRVLQLGVESASALHSWEVDEVRHVMFISRTWVAGKPIPEQLSYARVLSNEIRRSEQGTRIADTEEHFLNLREDYYAISTYQGQAIEAGSGFRLRPGSPPLAVREGMEVKQLHALKYNPKLPSTLHSASPLADLNRQRTEAGRMLSLLEKLSSGTEDLLVPYEQ
jgi:hypothetical protein